MPPLKKRFSEDLGKDAIKSHHNNNLAHINKENLSINHSNNHNNHNIHIHNNHNFLEVPEGNKIIVKDNPLADKIICKSKR